MVAWQGRTSGMRVREVNGLWRTQSGLSPGKEVMYAEDPMSEGENGAAG